MAGQFETPDDVWLLNLGFVSEHAEQNLMLYGHIATPGIEHCELMINAEARKISYAVVLSKQSFRRYKIQGWLEKKSGLFGKLGLLCFLRMFGSYDPAGRIARCIRDYAGPSWSTSTEVISVREYLKIVSSSGTEGWIFKDGPSQSSGTPGQDGSSPTPAPSR